MAAHEVIALRKIVAPRLSGVVNGTNERFEANLNLPEGCSGILYAFGSKKAARSFFGDDVELVKISSMGVKGRVSDE